MNLRDSKQPKWSFTIPSAYDGTKLDCRIFHPASDSAPGPARSYHGAIVAHPYGPLGGSYDDPVVAAATTVLRNSGLYVATFNFRKPGLLRGNTSLSGNPEVIDYVSVLACLATYLQCVKTYHAGGLLGDPEPLKIVYGGYSYGSLIASRMPATRTVGEAVTALDVLSTSGPHLDKIATQARLHAYKHFYRRAPEGEDVGNPADQEDILTSPSYLLISPLLGPAIYFVTPTAKNKPGLDTATKDSPLAQRPTLALYGDADGFTGVDKLNQWSEKLAAAEDSHFRYKRFQDVDHFWHELGAIQSLQREVQEWIFCDVLNQPQS